MPNYLKQLTAPTSVANPKKKFVQSGVQQYPQPISPTRGVRNDPSRITANTAATSTNVPSLTTQPNPARQQFVQSQIQNVDPNVFTTPSGAKVNADTGRLADTSFGEGAFYNPPDSSARATTRSDPQASYRSAFDSYISSLQPSSKEQEAQKYLSGLLDTSRREEEKALQTGETLGFASGEASRVNRNRAFDIQAASDALSSLTGQRSAMTEAQKARLDFEKSLLGDAAEGFTLGEGQRRFDAQGNVIASNTIASDGGVTKAADSWASLVARGDAKLSDVPTALKSSVADILSNQTTLGGEEARNLGKAALVINKAQEALSKVSALSAGIGGQSLRNIGGTPAFDLAQTVNTIQGNIGFAELQAMRDASPTGGALGQVSERELQLLSSVISALDTAQSPSQLKENLGQVVKFFEDYQNDQVLKYLQENPDATDEEIAELLEGNIPQSFNKVGGADTNQGTVAIPRTARLAFVNNNPGNLRFAGQTGATQGEGGFAKFSSPEAGYQALQNQIKLDAGRGLTLAQFVTKYAPPSENNTQQYLQQILQSTGAKSSTPIQQIDLNTLARAIAQKESSTKIYA